MKSCVICGKKKDLVVHHVRYIPEEIIILCRSCHSKVHREKQNDKETKYCQYTTKSPKFTPTGIIFYKKLVKTGTSLAAFIPKIIAKQIKLKHGNDIEIEYDERRHEIIIRNPEFIPDRSPISSLNGIEEEKPLLSSGGSLFVPIPAIWAKGQNLKKGSHVLVKVKGDEVIIKKIKK